MADSMLASAISILEGGVGSHEKCTIKEEGGFTRRSMPNVAIAVEGIRLLLGHCTYERSWTQLPTLLEQSHQLLAVLMEIFQSGVP
jgi:hypothetical protein